MRISEEKNIINKPTRCNMEMNQDTLEKMLGMNLKGMYYAFKTSLETHRTESMTTDQFVSWLVSSEWDDRRNRAVERAIWDICSGDQLEQEKVIWQPLLASKLARKDIKYYTPTHPDLWGCLRLPRRKVQSCKNSRKSRG